jgi:DNA-binding response OmpR family regulator
MKTILVIDDDPIMRDTIRDILQAEGYNIIIASNGKEGMAHMGNKTIELILTDVLMPEKDGIEVIMETKLKHPLVKILAISGGGYISGENYLKMARDLGANASVIKPFDIDDLVAEVNRLLGNDKQPKAS